MTLHVVPIESIEDRYSAQWNRWWPRELNLRGIDYSWCYPVGEWGEWAAPKGEHFLDPIGTHAFKARQIGMLCRDIRRGHIKADDTILFHDLWFPGLEALFYIRDLVGPKFKIAGMLHAGSYTPHDVLDRYGMGRWAGPIEAAWFHEVDKIFVATEYHQQLLRLQRGVGSIVTGFPLYTDDLLRYKGIPKENIVVFPFRIAEERGVEEWDSLVDLFHLRSRWQFIRSHDVCKNKDEYYELLARSKIVLSTSWQETWGIAVQEAVLLGCVPLVPNKFAYAEIYPRSCRYTPGSLDLSFKLTAMLEHLDKLELEQDVLVERIVSRGKQAIPNILQSLGIGNGSQTA